MKAGSGEISVTRALSLAFLAHGNEDLEDFLDSNGVDTVLDCLFKNRFQDFRGPLAIMDRDPFAYLDCRNPPGQFLPLCDESDYLPVYRGDVFTDMVEGHTMYSSPPFA